MAAKYGTLPAMEAMMPDWEDARLMVWGKTYPELSKKYTETVCAGAVRLDQGGGLIRIFPLSERYLEQGRVKQYSIIRARLKKADRDRRPESFRLAPDFEIESVVGTDGSGWDDRAREMLRPDHMVAGLEDMEEQQANSGKSLGIVSNVELVSAKLREVKKAELEEAWEKYKFVQDQREFWDPGTKPVPPLRWKPVLTFKAPGDSKEYTRICLDWGICELAKRLVVHDDRDERFEAKLRSAAFKEDRESHVILGNINQWPGTFVVVGLFYPPRKRQTGLFTL